MTTARHYANAPITEAIIDIRVDELPGTHLDRLQHALDSRRCDFPKVKQVHVASGKMQLGPQLTTSASTRPIGLWFENVDRRYVCQVRLDGFTLSRLAPYERWEVFRDEARALWSLYRSAIQPPRITRLAVRYINRVDIPLPLRDLKDYLRTVPEVSADLPQGLAGYFMRLMIPLDDIRSMCFLNQGMIDPVRPDAVSVVLDIDVFRQEVVPGEETEMWEFVERLRARKNDVFEACITDKARELFR